MLALLAITTLAGFTFPPDLPTLFSVDSIATLALSCSTSVEKGKHSIPLPEEPIGGAMLQLFPVSGSVDKTDRDALFGGPTLIGVIKEGGRKKSERYGVPMNGKVCVFVVRATYPGSPLFAFLFEPVSMRVVRVMPAEFTRHSKMPPDDGKIFQEPWACWSGDMVGHAECPEVPVAKAIDDFYADASNKPSSMSQSAWDAARLQARVDLGANGAWFSCASNGCCRIS